MLIPLNLLVTKYKIVTKGIIHIGAHLAEEAEIYNTCEFEKVLWIEGNIDLIPFLENKILNYPTQKVYHAMIDSLERDTTFHITNNLQSSSIFALKEHSTQYPGIVVEKIISCKTQRLDNFLKQNKIQHTDYNFLNLDIQGNELNALKSLGTILNNFDYVYTEIQITELYEKSHNLLQLDLFLYSQGFRRVETDLTYLSWGDAFYVRYSSKRNIFFDIKLIESLFLVYSWPIRKKILSIKKRINYHLKNSFILRRKNWKK